MGRGGGGGGGVTGLLNKGGGGGNRLPGLVTKQVVELPQVLARYITNTIHYTLANVLKHVLMYRLQTDLT